MKKTKIFSRAIIPLISMLLPLSIIKLHAAEGDFNAWELKAGSGGMSCTDISFTEKDITIELWLYIKEADFKSGVTIASTRHNGSHGFSLDVSSDGRLRGFFRNDNGDKLNSRPGDYIFPFFFAKEDVVDKWVHIALVFSSSNNIARSYLNGEMYEDLVKSTEPYEPYNIGWIGNIKDDGSNAGGLRIGYWYEDKAKLTGKIADFRIWNVGRTDEEIKDNYNKPLAGSEPGLHMYFNFTAFSQAMNNPGSRGGTAYLLPAANWSEVNVNEILSQKPRRLTITGDELTWQGEGQSWDVEVRSQPGNSLIKSGTTAEKSFSLSGISQPYTVYVRARNNGFCSGWAGNLIRVGCVGDSNTYGAEASDRSKYAWPVQIRTMLGPRYETQNFGVSGALMMDHLNDAWKNKTAYARNKSYDPDIIVIALGTNDSKDGYWDADKFRTSYINLINEFKSYPAHPEIYMALPIKAYSRSWNINDAVIRRDIIPIMKEISKEAAVPLIDLYAATSDIDGLMAPDGIHPQDEGLRIIARKIADIMLMEKPRITAGGVEPAQKYAAYTWYKNDVVIENAGGAVYTAPEAGTYKAGVKLTANTHDVIFSEPVQISGANTVLAVSGIPPSSSLPEAEAGSLLRIQPYAGGLYVENGSGGKLSIYTSGGQLLRTIPISRQKQFISIHDVPLGTYIGRIKSGNQHAAVKIIR